MIIYTVEQIAEGFAVMRGKVDDPTDPHRGSRVVVVYNNPATAKSVARVLGNLTQNEPR